MSLSFSFETDLISLDSLQKIFIDYSKGIGRSVAFSHCSDFVYIAKTSIYQVSLNPLKILSKFNENLEEICVLALAFDGSLIAAGDREGKIEIFDTETKSLIFSTNTLDSYISYLTFFHKSKEKFLVAYQEYDIEVWDLALGLLRKLKFKDILVNAVLTSDNSKIYVVGESFLTVFDLCLGSEEYFKNFYQDFTIALTSDQSRVVMGGVLGTISIFYVDTQKGVKIENPNNREWISTLALSANDQFAATSGLSSKIQIWDLTTPQLFLEFERNSAPDPHFLFFCSNSKHIISSYNSTNIAVWNLSTSQRSLIGHHLFPIINASMSPCRLKFVTSALDGIKIWNATLFYCLGQIPGHTQGVTGVVFEENNKKFVSVGKDKTLRVWRLTGEEIKAVSSIQTLTNIKIVHKKYILGSSENYFIIFKQII